MPTPEAHIDVNNGSLTINELVEQRKTLSREQFHKAINEALHDSSNNTVTLYDTTSCAELYKVLENLKPEAILKAEIVIDNSRDNYAIDVLNLNLHLTGGTLKVDAPWCLYKPERTKECVESLLNPLKKNGLMGRTSIIDGQGYVATDYPCADLNKLVKQLKTLSETTRPELAEEPGLAPC